MFCEIRPRSIVNKASLEMCEFTIGNELCNKHFDGTLLAKIVIFLDISVHRFVVVAKLGFYFLEQCILHVIPKLEQKWHPRCFYLGNYCCCSEERLGDLKLAESAVE